MSSPHFYQAEEKFAEAIFGMKPNKEQHQTTIDVHPVGNYTAPRLRSRFLSPTRGRCMLRSQAA